MKYYISFDTRIMPGAIEAITVDLDVETVTDMDKKMNVSLCDHPLYSDLVKYVKANPR